MSRNSVQVVDHWARSFEVGKVGERFLSGSYPAHDLGPGGDDVGGFLDQLKPLPRHGIEIFGQAQLRQHLAPVLVRSTSVSAALPAARSDSSSGSTFSTSLNKVVSAAAGSGGQLLVKVSDRPEGGEPLVDRCQLPTGSLAPLRGPLADALIDTEIEEGREEVLPVGRLVM